MLKSVGTLDRATPGSTEPDEVEQRMRIARQIAESKLADDALSASLIGIGSMGLESSTPNSAGMPPLTSDSNPSDAPDLFNAPSADNLLTALKNHHRKRGK